MCCLQLTRQGPWQAISYLDDMCVLARRWYLVGGWWDTKILSQTHSREAKRRGGGEAYRPSNADARRAAPADPPTEIHVYLTTPHPVLLKKLQIIHYNSGSNLYPFPFMTDTNNHARSRELFGNTVVTYIIHKPRKLFLPGLIRIILQKYTRVSDTFQTSS